MAINAYIGIPGSGKTYEVVHSVILPAFLNGRRVVTNIEGIVKENFINYVHKFNETKKDDSKIDLERLGDIIKISDDDVLLDNFFPFKGSSDTETIAKNGDLICIDEVWRIFDEAKKIKENHKSFIAEHRHFTNEQGNTCDLVVISQSVSNIPRFIKDRIENTYRMTKLKALGLNSRYRIDVFSGAKTFKTNLVYSIQSKYDPEIFKLYKSYDKENAKERAIDSRQNLLKSSGFIIKMALSLLFMILGGIYLYSTLSENTQPRVQKSEDIKYSDELKKPLKTPSSEDSNHLRKSTFNNSNVSGGENKENKPLSFTWRIVGYLSKDNNRLVILTDGFYVRYELLNKFKSHGNMLHGEIDGETVTIYSGNHKKQYQSKGFFYEK